MQNKIPYRPLLLLEMTTVPAPASGAHTMEGGAHHSWRWQSPRELLHVTEETVLSWLQTQQLPRHPGSRHPTRKKHFMFCKCLSTNPFVSLVLFLLQHPMVLKKALAAHTAAKYCGVWKQEVTFLHSPPHKTRDCKEGYSFHYWDHRRNYSLAPRPGTLTTRSLWPQAKDNLIN